MKILIYTLCFFWCFYIMLLSSFIRFSLLSLCLSNSSKTVNATYILLYCVKSIIHKYICVQNNIFHKIQPFNDYLYSFEFFPKNFLYKISGIYHFLLLLLFCLLLIVKSWYLPLVLTNNLFLIKNSICSLVICFKRNTHLS